MAHIQEDSYLDGILNLTPEQQNAMTNFGWSGMDEGELDDGVFNFAASGGKNSSSSDVTITKSGILGVPFQFNNWADVRSESFGSKSIGRVYERNIWSNMPLVFFEVGKPLYLNKLLNTSKHKNLIANLYADDSDQVSYDKQDMVTMAAGLGKNRFYGFMDDYLNYTNYVNTMFRFTAIQMGLGNEEHEESSQKYYRFDVTKLRNDSLWRMLSNNNYISVYCSPSGTSVSESGSNTVGESQLSSTFNSVSATSREVSYLFGEGAANELDEASISAYNEQVDSFTSGFGTDSSWLKTMIGNGATSIKSGANLLFPHMWQDSQFSKSYTINMKFSSPYGDPESILMNVYLPFFHILAMAMPRQSSSQGYKSPFIIKCYSKGWFNCDMGMVESIDIKRGGANGDEWTIDGYPNEIEVSITIRDLYPTIMATVARSDGLLFTSNVSLTAYLNAMAGVDLHKITPADNVISIAAMLAGNIANIPNAVAKKFTYSIYKNIKFLANKWLN